MPACRNSGGAGAPAGGQQWSRRSDRRSASCSGHPRPSSTGDTAAQPDPPPCSGRRRQSPQSSRSWPVSPIGDPAEQLGHVSLGIAAGISDGDASVIRYGSAALVPVPVGGLSRVGWDGATRAEARDFCRWLQVEDKPVRAHWRYPGRDAPVRSREKTERPNPVTVRRCSAGCGV